MVNFEKPLLFIDTSYVVFYRYYAILTWYKMSHKGVLVKSASEFLDSEFLDKYHKTFIYTLETLSHQYRVPFENMVFAKDCPRDSNWRLFHYAQYKCTRSQHTKNFNPYIFQYTYNEVLPKFIERNACITMSHSSLEADDCIALAIEYLRTEQQYCGDITVITNDNDYIQLHNRGVKLMNLQGKSLYDRIESDLADYVQIKCIMGDASDNIPPIAPKIGNKTAIKIVGDPMLLERYLDNPDSKARYQLNCLLIKFDNVPPELSRAFIEDTCVTMFGGANIQSLKSI